MDVQIQKQNMETDQMDGGVEVFPDESIVPHIPTEEQDLNLSKLPNQLTTNAN